MVGVSSLEIEDHARLFNLKGDVDKLKRYLRDRGYVIVYSGIDGYDVIFDERNLGRNAPCDGQIDHNLNRLVVFRSSRLEGVIEGYRQTASASDSSPAQNEQAAGSPSGK